jgi:hypothetical protein
MLGVQLLLPLRQSLTGTFSAVTVVMAARSGVPAKSETFPGDSGICVFPDSDVGLLYSFAALNHSEWGKYCGPQARRLINGGRASSWCSYPTTAEIDR